MFQLTAAIWRIIANKGNACRKDFARVLLNPPILCNECYCGTFGTYVSFNLQELAKMAVICRVIYHIYLPLKVINKSQNYFVSYCLNNRLSVT